MNPKAVMKDGSPGWIERRQKEDAGASDKKGL